MPRPSAPTVPSVQQLLPWFPRPLGLDGACSGDDQCCRHHHHSLILGTFNLTHCSSGQEAHTMNIYQLCGPQEHDDNDNITSGFVSCQSNNDNNDYDDTTSRMILMPMKMNDNENINFSPRRQSNPCKWMLQLNLLIECYLLVDKFLLVLELFWILVEIFLLVVEILAVLVKIFLLVVGIFWVLVEIFWVLEEILTKICWSLRLWWPSNTMVFYLRQVFRISTIIPKHDGHSSSMVFHIVGYHNVQGDLNPERNSTQLSSRLCYQEILLENYQQQC